ncbi:hypothetical protein SEVIR_4G066800v4 [Setaria viridis]|uniref:Uncharacterized protein n=1 Tax=Setaria viridis TaxID=4556 RepID=A0A4U6UUK0_SETVI|nr:uncharacterized protein LOC117854225 [Setaria viridis]TKW20148.1 hypothetical protein SEVIR_4G066800v2 [Setaria viridis]
MSFPPSQSLESAAVRKGKSTNSASIGFKRSRSGSNQLEPIPVSSEQTSQQTIAPVKAKAKRKRKQPAKKQGKNLVLPFDSPAMCTRSKKWEDPASPAMSTKSKRRLSL